MELYLLVPDCKCNKLRGAETLVRVKVSSPGFGTPAPVFTSRWERMVIGADFSERMSQKPEPTPCRDFKDPQLGKRFEVSDVIVIGQNIYGQGIRDCWRASPVSSVQRSSCAGGSGSWTTSWWCRGFGCSLQGEVYSAWNIESVYNRVWYTKLSVILKSKSFHINIFNNLNCPAWALCRKTDTLALNMFVFLNF